MILSPQDREKISDNIKQVESKSGAELVAVIARRSGDYSFFWLLASAVIVFVLSAVLVLNLSESAFYLLNVQVVTFAAIYTFFYFFGDKCIRFLPKFYTNDKSSKFAHDKFYSLGINRTNTRQGVMFFVSTQERYVQIIADEAICEKVENSYWEKIVEDFVAHVKRGEFALGYICAIKECGDILVDRFPIKDDDENELSDEVIEL